MRNLTQRLLLLTLVTSLLTSCATGNSDPACVCPPVKEYSKELQVKMADEIKAAPPDASFPDALRDYALLRAQLRVCK